MTEKLATRYFLEQVVRKRAYLTLEMCQQVVRDPMAVTTQPDGRKRYWARIRLPDEAEERILRVVTLEDGETLHNAFIDRNFREEDYEAPLLS